MEVGTTGVTQRASPVHATLKKTLVGEIGKISATRPDDCSRDVPLHQFVTLVSAYPAFRLDRVASWRQLLHRWMLNSRLIVAGKALTSSHLALWSRTRSLCDSSTRTGQLSMHPSPEPPACHSPRPRTTTSGLARHMSPLSQRRLRSVLRILSSSSFARPR